jgi:hypothetical protein
MTSSGIGRKMPRNRLGYVNRSALIDREQSMTASSLDKASAKPSCAQQSDVHCEPVHCEPMSHQNSGDHGYEMYPQKFVRLVGCHDVPSSALRKPQDEKLH